jgi:hypothetical protein
MILAASSADWLLAATAGQLGVGIYPVAGLRVCS